MNARFGRILPSLPLILAVVIAVLFLVAIWIAPATNAGNSVRTTEGSVQTFSWRGDVERTQRMEWPYTVDVQGDPDEVAILPRLPFSFAVNGESSSSGTADLAMDIYVYVNGVQVHRRQTGATSTEGGQGGYRYHTADGLPETVGDVEQGHLRTGSNEILVVADFHLTIQTEGTERFDVAAGPVHSYLYQADGDGDGVVDAHQFVQGVHTGWIAIPGAFALGTASFLGVRKLLRRKEG